MGYSRLPFEQYFINTSEDYKHTGLATWPVAYTSSYYSCSTAETALGFRHEVNYEYHYEPERDVIQFNFQCTIGLPDWFANIFESSDKYYDAIDFEGEPLQLRVHHGWGQMYRAAKNEIRGAWERLHAEHPTAAAEIVGWSLGSAQAMLCSQDLNYNYGLRAHLFTFGSVRPFKAERGDSERLRRYLSSLCEECWNFADVNDIVTYMPPFRGFAAIRRVDVSDVKRRSVFRLLNPLRYHTCYHRAELYAKLQDANQ